MLNYAILLMYADFIIIILKHKITAYCGLGVRRILIIMTKRGGFHMSKRRSKAFLVALAGL